MKKILKCGTSGFTLLEIMIALAIISIALTVVIHTVNYHATIMYENTLLTEMYQFAKEKMKQLEDNPQSSTGNIGTAGMEYVNTASPIKDTDLIELTTVVKGQGKQVVLNSLVLKKQNQDGNR